MRGLGTNGRLDPERELCAGVKRVLELGEKLDRFVVEPELRVRCDRLELGDGERDPLPEPRYRGCVPLPLTARDARPHAAILTVDSRAPGMGDREPRTVLVVDDDIALRLLCRVNLELDGHRVLEAAAPEQARELLASEGVDAVLLDLHLGLEDGLELVEEIRRAGAGVALLTGTPDIPPETRDRVDAVLTKPFAIDGLLTAVRGLVSLPLR